MRFKKNFLLLSSIVICLSPITIHAQTRTSAPVQSVLKERGQIDFYAKGKPSMLTIHGTNEHLTGSASRSGDKVMGKFLVSMNQFVTGMQLRDEHLKTKVFDSKQFPTSELTVDPIVLKNGSYDGAFKGKLKFHGIEKEVSGQTKIHLDGNTIVPDASFSIKLSEGELTAASVSRSVGVINTTIDVRCIDWDLCRNKAPRTGMCIRPGTPTVLDCF